MDTCKHGHPRTPGNTYHHPDGYTYCRVCKREGQRQARTLVPRRHELVVEWPTELPARFWAKVHKDGPLWEGSPCWLWYGYRNAQGYGRVSLGDLIYQAHVLAYSVLVGPVPPGCELHHKCHNRACVNPVHLEPLTHRAHGSTRRHALRDARARIAELEAIIIELSPDALTRTA